MSINATNVTIDAMLTRQRRHENFVSNIHPPICALVQTLPFDERCDFVRKTEACQEGVALVNYIHLLYCDLNANNEWKMWFGVVLLVLMCAYLFIVLGCTADAFFCPALNVLSSLLGLSENVAGVTLVAFGNSASDFFTSLAGIKDEKRVIFSDIIGGTAFVMLIVGGCIILVRPFVMQPAIFLRDFLFLMLDMLILQFLTDSKKSLSTVGCAMFMSLYVFYILVVILDQYLVLRTLKEIKREKRRNKPSKKEKTFIKMEATVIPISLATRRATADKKAKLRLRKFQALARAARAADSSESKSDHGRQDGERENGPDGERERESQRTSRKASAKNEQETERDGQRTATSTTIHNEPEDGNENKQQSEGENKGDREQNNESEIPPERNSESMQEHKHASDDDSDPEHPRASTSPSTNQEQEKDGEKDTGASIISKRESYTIPSDSDVSSTESSDSDEVDNVPSTATATKQTDQKKTDQEKTDQEKRDQEKLDQEKTDAAEHRKSETSESSMSSTDKHTEPLSFYAATMIMISKSLQESCESFECFKRKNLVLPEETTLCKQFWQTVNPISDDFKHLSYPMRFFIILKVPIMLVLTMLIPVVDYEKPIYGWSKLLNSLQLMLLPMFITFAMKGMQVTFHLPLVLWVLLCTCPVAVYVYLNTSANKVPLHFKLYCILGMMGSMIVIFLSAKEIINILTVIGIATYCSSSFLGCTLLAWGNSVGDLITNTAMARQGYPKMGFAACIGGPLFSSIITIGTVYIYKSVYTSNLPSDVGQGTMGTNSIIFVLIGVSLLLCVGLTTNFVLRRSIGAFMIALYVTYCMYALLGELQIIHPFGSDHRSDLKPEPAY